MIIINFANTLKFIIDFNMLISEIGLELKNKENRSKDRTLRN